MGGLPRRRLTTFYTIQVWSNNTIEDYTTIAKRSIEAMTHKFLPSLFEIVSEIISHYFETIAHFTFLTCCITFLFDFSWGKSFMMPIGFLVQLLIKLFVNKVIDHVVIEKKTYNPFRAKGFGA